MKSTFCINLYNKLALNCRIPYLDTFSFSYALNSAAPIKKFTLVAEELAFQIIRLCFDILHCAEARNACCIGKCI